MTWGQWGHRHGSGLIAVLAALVAIASGCAESAGEPTAASDAESASTEASTATDADETPENETPEDEASEAADADITSESTPERSEAPAPESSDEPERATSEPRPRSFLVVRAVDGDTLELGNGQRVRVIGIDTPERGECDYDTATRAMAGLVVGEGVTLTRVDEDTDRYGRLLRYVDVAGMDAGFQMIRRGLANARYDSRDGYGFHPREPRYIRANDAAPQRNCAPEPPPPTNNAGGGNCAPGYDPCVPPYPPDVDCADVDGPVRVSGSDPHGLDRDGDGVACE